MNTLFNLSFYVIFDISKIKCKQIQIEVKAAKQGIRSVTHLKFEKIVLAVKGSACTPLYLNVMCLSLFELLTFEIKVRND